MIFTETVLPGAYVVELEKHSDARGWFARGYCQKEFEAHGIVGSFLQANISHAVWKGTLRGLHYQVPPFGDAKFVRCIRGTIYDVIVDLRPDSPTLKQWFGVELSADNGKALYFPELFGHGFLSLQDNTQVLYQVCQYYSPAHERGFRFDDPAFGIKWPGNVAKISEKDLRWSDWSMSDLKAD